MRLYINKFEDKFEYLEEMDNFLRKFELPKWEFLIPSELESLSKPISIEGIEELLRDYSTKEHQIKIISQGKR